MNKSRIEINILDRVRKAYNLANDTKLAEFLGVGQSTVANWRSRGSFNIELIISKCDEINTNWLLRGEGPIWKDQIAKPGVSYESFEERLDLFVARAIQQINNADVQEEEKEKIVQSLIRIGREAIAKIDREEKSND